ncbi:hypothetical protein [Vibrio sp. H11]|uniref:hypothetical protein n=1 Tax=Vibrio sp. H11 TaxID=2565928 RepID=UPI0010A661C2|nr:hypothetical protein [Vibrio sp. H11]
MTNDEMKLAELKAKPKLTAGDRAQIKILENAIKKSAKSKPDNKTNNAFAIKPTTKLAPLPIRFSSDERTGLTQLKNDIKTQNQEKVITELGSDREINDTKLIRAAIYLLKTHSHDEIIDAIKQVKLNMIR